MAVALSQSGSESLAPVLDGVIARLAEARGLLASGAAPRAHRLMHAATIMLGALRSSMQPASNDGLAANLGELYDYAARRVAAAAVQRDRAPLDEAWHLLKEVRTVWFALPEYARVSQFRLPRGSGRLARGKVACSTALTQ
jgi:flagellin-specific chaperone FliS